jgi:hypothetical protein
LQRRGLACAIAVHFPHMGALMPELKDLVGWNLHRRATFTEAAPLYYTSAQMPGMATFTTVKPPHGLAAAYTQVPGAPWLRMLAAADDPMLHTALRAAMLRRVHMSAFPELMGEAAPQYESACARED